MFGWVEEDLEVADATLLPLAGVPVPSEQLGALLKQDFLVLLSRLCLHLRDTQLRKNKMWSCVSFTKLHVRKYQNIGVSS